MNDDFEKSWIEHYKKTGDKRNRTVALVALIAGTVLIIPDVLLAESYSRSLLIIRIMASSIGFLGYILFRLKKIQNSAMVLFYALPVFIVSSYMVALQSDETAITQLNNTLAVVGIFFIALFILKVSIWIVITAVLYFSYCIFIVVFAEISFTEYLIHGGSLVLIGFFTFPFVARVRYRMQKENYMLNYEVKCQKEELEFYANNDVLTGAFNRRGGMHILEQSISMSARHKIPLTICFIDINGLKKVNDVYGHDAGDMLIQTVARLIKENIRKSDSLFRFGGDEFVIVFPGCTYGEGSRIVEKIHSETADFKFDETKDMAISFSYGLSEYIDKMSMDDFIKSADLEMYRDKN